MLLQAVADGPSGLRDEQIEDLLSTALEGVVADERLLVLIPDGTRTIPLPRLFPMLVRALRRARSIEVMVALGTHPPLSRQRLLALLGVGPEQLTTQLSRCSFGNHAWSDPEALQRIGSISGERVREIAGDFWHPSLGDGAEVRINRAALEADRIVILGPTYPHEVAGFSGGAKYLFPGISGPEMIDVTHWLGALAGIMRTIGVKNTPVRRLIHEATRCLATRVSLIDVVLHEDELRGMFIGDVEETWSAAADLSAQLHIVSLDRPLEHVISWAPSMYADLWTAGKAMYKLEPALADGAEIIIYAPHLDAISPVHGALIRDIGYHVLPYFLKRWDRFSQVPLGVLAHSTHVKGAGTYDKGTERPRVQVKLASRISREETEALNLGYVDPATIDPHHVGPGVTLIPKAGEVLYRVSSGTQAS
ncbi:MAG TPA: lactate racemase domain-containing protein [Chloroflexota bacterium]|nr:lactate racemase domain-containing protein [Chloroflexota bacterium]